MSIFSSITDFLASAIKRPVKKITKEEFKNLIDINIRRLEILKDSLKTINSLNKDLVKQIDSLKNDRSKEYIKLYFDFAYQMNKTADAQNPLMAIQNTVITTLDIHEAIMRKLNNIVGGRDINIYNAKISHAIVFGFISKTRELCDYAYAFVGGIIYDITTHDNVPEIAMLSNKQQQLLIDNFKSVTTFVNNTNSNGYSNVVKAIDNFATTDDNLISSDGTNSRIDITKLSGRNGFSALTLSLITSAFIFIVYAIPRAAGWIATLQDVWYQDIKAEAEWIHNHIALLEMELAGKDPDSEEYRKTVKIIDKYKEILAKLEAKIEQYESEE